MDTDTRMDRIWEYYRRAAEKTGKKNRKEAVEEEGEQGEEGEQREQQAAYSVLSQMAVSPEEENNLVRAYLGDEPPWPPCPGQRERRRRRP